MGTGIFLELWPSVLSFCGRGWFVPERDGTEEDDGFAKGSEEDRKVSANLDEALRQESGSHREVDGRSLSSESGSEMETTQFRLEE